MIVMVPGVPKVHQHYGRQICFKNFFSISVEKTVWWSQSKLSIRWTLSLSSHVCSFLTNLPNEAHFNTQNIRNKVKVRSLCETIGAADQEESDWEQFCDFGAQWINNEAGSKTWASQLA